MEIPTNVSIGSTPADLTKFSVGALVLFASCQLSNSAIFTDNEETVIPPNNLLAIQNLSADVGDALVGEENTYETFPVAVSREEAVEVLSEFLHKLTTNIVSAPGNVHAAIAERPWDFV
jgi:hypothetical protein